MENKEKINYGKLNEILKLGSSILKLMYILIIVIGVYSVTLIFKEWKIFPFLINILKVISPLFIGIIIAWLFDPLVTYFNKKGIRRGIGSSIIYIVLIIAIYLIINSIIPILLEQVNDLVNSIPSILEKFKIATDDLFDKLGNSSSLNINDFKYQIFNAAEEIGKNMTVKMPNATIAFLKEIASGIWVFLFGLVIGFYFLLDFDKETHNFVKVLPLKWQNDFNNLTNEMNNSLRRFVQGTIAIATLIFVVCSIGFTFAGLKAPLLFGLFCGVTNIIPYVGPYIGGIPSVLVGFSMGTTTGIATLIIVIVVQFIESWILQPIVMGERVNLHPITIIVGLLLFGYFFGIVGMIFATPILAIIKLLISYFNKKYDFINKINVITKK